MCSMHFRRFQPSVIWCGVSVCAGLMFPLTAALAQPPDARNKVEIYVPQTEKAWKELRVQVGVLEFTDTQAAIARYQQFYEQQGFNSARTAIEISSTIAQLYWQALDNPQKSLEIYDWAIEKYGFLLPGRRLKTERDWVAQTGSFRSSVDVSPVIIGGVPEVKEETSPGKVLLGTSQTALPDKVILQSPQIQSTNAAVAAKVLLPKPDGLPDAVALTPASKTSPAAVSPIDPRVVQLTGYVSQWRTGKLSPEDLFTKIHLTASDALTMLSAPGILTSWKIDMPLRQALMKWLMEHSPQSLEPSEKLSLPAQVALAEYYGNQKDERAEKMYQYILTQDLPRGVWWHRLLVMNCLAEYYGNKGEYVKAAEAKLQIARQTGDATWISNTQVEAARYYIQAGQPEKAAPLYEKAEKSSYGWAAGMALWDQAYALMQKKHYKEARKVLSQSISGQYADQVQVLLTSAMSVSYYRERNLDQARKYGKETLAQYKVLKKPLKNEGIEGQVEVVEGMLDMIEQWEKRDVPIFVNPTELSMFVNRGDQPLVWQLVIRSLNPVMATVTSNSPKVKVRPITQEPVDTNLFGFTNVVELTIAADDVNAVLTIRSPEYPDWEEKVPVIMELCKTKDEQTVDTITVY